MEECIPRHVIQDVRSFAPQIRRLNRFDPVSAVSRGRFVSGRLRTVRGVSDRPSCPCGRNTGPGEGAQSREMISEKLLSAAAEPPPPSVIPRGSGNELETRVS